MQLGKMGNDGDMCPLCVPHHLGSHRVRRNNSSKMIIKSIQPTYLTKARRHSTAGTDRAGTAASFGAVPPQSMSISSASISSSKSTSATDPTDSERNPGAELATIVEPNVTLAPATIFQNVARPLPTSTGHFIFGVCRTMPNLTKFGA
jgi:hypothetical protein